MLLLYLLEMGLFSHFTEPVEHGLLIREHIIIQYENAVTFTRTDTSTSRTAGSGAVYRRRSAVRVLR